MAALANPSCGCVPVGRAGCVLGYLFGRDGSGRQTDRLNAEEAAAIAASGGRALIGTSWGGYAVAIADAGGVRILRDPSGNFPCYYSSRRGLAAFVSNAELLVESDFSPVFVGLEEIGRQLYCAFVPTPDTALHCIRELLACFAIRFPDEFGQPEPCWSPGGMSMAVATVRPTARSACRASSANAFVPGHRSTALVSTRRLRCRRSNAGSATFEAS
jgi:hypothetical protein